MSTRTSPPLDVRCFWSTVESFGLADSYMSTSSRRPSARLADCANANEPLTSVARSVRRASRQVRRVSMKPPCQTDNGADYAGELGGAVQTKRTLHLQAQPRLVSWRVARAAS